MIKLILNSLSCMLLNFIFLFFKIIGKRYYEARGKKSLKIIESLKTNKISKVTIGGCIIEKVNQTVILSKEFK